LLDSEAPGRSDSGDRGPFSLRARNALHSQPLSRTVQSTAPIPPSPRSPSGAVVRRFRGAVGDELHVLARPEDPAAGGPQQAASVYEALLAALEAGGACATDLITENVFLRPDAADYADAVRARARILGDAADTTAATFIGQAPLERDTGGEVARLEVAAFAFVPHDRRTVATRGQHRKQVEHVGTAASCECETCARGYRARLTPVGTHLHFHAGNIFGRANGAAGAEAEAFDMFCEAEKLLAAAGMDFRDVIRTWIHLRDIDRDYSALNRARRDFFASRGIDRRPASTGVQGIPFAAPHAFSMSLFAVKSPRPLEVPLMSTPTLNEAWTYGADFSRGLRLVDDNKVSLVISGTASIDERGASVHERDLAAQTARMLHNIETLLAEQGAGFEQLVSAITYVKFGSDAPLLRRLLASHGFDGFPLAVVEAPLCRPELLCETEAVAVLPLPEQA
jgi:enamine deaminase RidA (YjgF/YER057c/UK114 family)